MTVHCSGRYQLRLGFTWALMKRRHPADLEALSPASAISSKVDYCVACDGDDGRWKGTAAGFVHENIAVSVSDCQPVRGTTSVELE